MAITKSKPNLRRYRWYAVKKSEYSSDVFIGQCLGSNGNDVALKYADSYDFFRNPHKVDRDKIIEEVNDPRYLFRVAKVFGRVFMDLNYNDVKY